MILRVLCGVMGILVSQEGARNRDQRVKVLVSNYTSTLDHLAVDLVLPNLLVGVTFYCFSSLDWCQI